MGVVQAWSHAHGTSRSGVLSSVLFLEHPAPLSPTPSFCWYSTDLGGLEGRFHVWLTALSSYMISTASVVHQDAAKEAMSRVGTKDGK